jgi:histidinol dehydrogenase
MSGTNHVLPTGGTARFSSPLGVDDFLKRSQYSYYTADALSNIYADVAYFADREGLHAHALSALARSRQEEEKNE